MLEGLERDAREGRKGLWADPQPMPQWEGERENSVRGQAYFLALARLDSVCVALSGTRIFGPK